ncbi:MAG: hypothetical protein ACP5OA_05485 [Candidatus Woesearchaeota archaeon]
MTNSEKANSELLESLIDENVHKLELLAIEGVPVKDFISYSKKFSVAKYLKDYVHESHNTEKSAICLCKVVDFTTKYFSKKKCYPDTYLMCVGNILFAEK